jgi:hypothetical protein
VAYDVESSVQGDTEVPSGGPDVLRNGGALVVDATSCPQTCRDMVLCRGRRGDACESHGLRDLGGRNADAAGSIIRIGWSAGAAGAAATTPARSRGGEAKSNSIEQGVCGCLGD